jgi:hypothetical protein
MAVLESAGLGAFGYALIGFLILIALVLVLGFYIYFAMAWSSIARKLKYPRPWLAWIPFANISMLLQLGSFSWAWVFLVLLPIGIMILTFALSSLWLSLLLFLSYLPLMILVFISMWRVFERRGFAGALSLVFIGTLIPFLSWLFWIAFSIIIGFVAWSETGEKSITQIKTRKI